MIYYEIITDLQYGYDSDTNGGRGNAPPPRPMVPDRHNRMRSIDYNASNSHDMNGMTNDTPHSKGILRASSEMHVTNRQGRDQDRKAKTPDLNNDPNKDDKKKRGKSPFAFFTRLRDASTERRNKGKTPEPNLAGRDTAGQTKGLDTAKSKLGVKNTNNVRISPVNYRRIT